MVNVTTNRQTLRYGEQTNGYSKKPTATVGRGGGVTHGSGLGVTNCQAHGELQGYTVQHRAETILYNNYKWSITFKNCEPPYCIPIS